MSNGYNLNYKNYIPQKLNNNHYLIGFLFLILFIGLGSLVGWYYYTDSNISNCSDYYKQHTKKDWSDCKDPGGKQNASTCNCDCNPGYGGVNCKTKNKNVSDLETTCKDKTGKPCVDCLKGWITKNLSGNASDVQDFKDDFNTNLISINNFCCQKNCSNASATVCDKCVSDSMQQLPHIKDDTAYFINNKGCLSSKITNQPQNFIGKTSVCNIQNPTPCIPNPCKNNSTCTVIDQNNFKCTCPPGPPFFDGPTCSKSCKKLAPSGDCGKINKESLCQYYFNSDNDKCSKTWAPFYQCTPDIGGDVGNDKCT